ncbi:MAG: methionyl-tRNA formyltransferase [Saprospiraceae bacterium]|jgi:methionyl-tRNA formyltransferase|tara:strand:- start:239 stop:1156 length:918 start_codon:yes stop_codon:yes gene_type:complete
MGTPEFAVPALQTLVENGFDVVGVITATDKMGGRGGKKLIESDVKKYAVSQGLNILQPKNLKSPEFVDQVRALKADLQIVVAFRMLPEVIWDMPEHGTYNLHGSLLPRFRGAAPIHWAVMTGAKETGVTSFKLKHEIDTGDLLFQERTKIEDEDTTGDVYTRLMHIGAKVVLKTVKAVQAGEVKLMEQDSSQVSKAPKIYHETCEIDFSKTTKDVYNHVRGLNPFPTAWTTIDGLECKVLKSGMSDEELDPEHKPGTILTDNKRYLKVACSDGYLAILDLKMQGKKMMDIKSLLNGYKVEGNMAG